MLNAKLFGTFQVFTGNREITGWRTRKTRELLALILHLEAPLGKERLIEELWQDADPVNSPSLFRTTMHYLRKQLDQEGLSDLIKYRQNSYYLDPERCLLDCKHFEKLVTTGLREEPLQELGAGMLTKAIKLYKGDYLGDESDYNWALPRQVRLKHLYSETLLSLARYYRSRAKHEKARQILLLLKEAEPFCEPAHRLLMQIYAALGERHAMADEMIRFNLMLQEEVGLPPALETMDLYRQLGCLK
jgi:two-component SAPR family response regulator